MTMTLIDAKAYLIDRRRATLCDIATHFESTPDAARQVLQHWVAKGRVNLLQGLPCKTGCSCSARPDEVYEWVARGPEPLFSR
ncbi:FeoC-like transcriptional regulator [uncultured Rhodoblastus sp.]|uniref:FeoC-like transcriptional regulator n=1 Tax=uncultured Rhodoblastus sp. TaxID=543037 RepID=UPI0025CB827A|nr:FeoC-like transcriptional regulator [uncultured Rhodoblastus sp.]